MGGLVFSFVTLWLVVFFSKQMLLFRLRIFVFHGFIVGEVFYRSNFCLCFHVGHLSQAFHLFIFAFDLCNLLESVGMSIECLFCLYSINFCLFSFSFSNLSFPSLNLNFFTNSLSNTYMLIELNNTFFSVSLNPLFLRNKIKNNWKIEKRKILCASSSTFENGLISSVIGNWNNAPWGFWRQSSVHLVKWKIGNDSRQKSKTHGSPWTWSQIQVICMVV